MGGVCRFGRFDNFSDRQRLVMPSYKQRYRRRNEMRITSLRYTPSKEIRVLNEKPKKLLVRFRYANGHYEIKEFDSDKDIGWYAYNEGDHLMDYEVINQ